MTYVVLSVRVAPRKTFYCRETIKGPILKTIQTHVVLQSPTSHIAVCGFIFRAQTNTPQVKPQGAQYAFKISRSHVVAFHLTYRSLLRSSSNNKPRYPSLKVVCVIIIFKVLGLCSHFMWIVPIYHDVVKLKIHHVPRVISLCFHISVRIW